MKKTKICLAVVLFMQIHAGETKVIEPIDDSIKKETIYMDNEVPRFSNRSLENSYYAGIGFGALQMEDMQGISTIFMLGYKVSDFLAFELRYSSLSEEVNEGRDNFKNLAVYAKQVIPTPWVIKPYALLGYGKTSFNAFSDLQMQWGAGLNYVYSNNVGVFFDYESKYNGDFEGTHSNVKLDALTLGTIYVF